jgi:hypothetical protein
MVDKKYLTRDELEAPETTKPKPAPGAGDDRNWLRKASDAIDSVFMPVANKIDTFTSGAQYGAMGELAPYLSAIPRGEMPSTIRDKRDALRKENPGTFKAGDMAGTVGRDLAITAATGGAGAPLSWAGTLGRGAAGGAIGGGLNEVTKFMPEALRAGEDYDPGQGLLRIGADAGIGMGASALGRGVGSFTGRGHLAKSGPMLTDVEQAAADRALNISADPRYGLQGAGKLNAAEAARAGAPEAPGLAAHGANLETLVRRAGAKASDKMAGPTRAAAVARAEPGGFLDQAARAQAQKATAEKVTDATLGTTPIPGARGGANFTPERQMFTKSARLEDPAIPAQAYPIIKETIGKSLFPDEAARAAAAVGRASPEAAREQGLDLLLRNMKRFGDATKGPVSNASVASGAPILKDMAGSASSVGAGAALLGGAGGMATNPGYATAARLIHENPRAALEQIGRGTPGMSGASGGILGVLDAIAQQAYLRPRKPKSADAD